MNKLHQALCGWHNPLVHDVVQVCLSWFLIHKLHSMILVPEEENTNKQTNKQTQEQIHNIKCCSFFSNNILRHAKFYWNFDRPTLPFPAGQQTAWENGKHCTTAETRLWWHLSLLVPWTLASLLEQLGNWWDITCRTEETSTIRQLTLNQFGNCLQRFQLRKLKNWWDMYTRYMCTCHRERTLTVRQFKRNIGNNWWDMYTRYTCHWERGIKSKAIQKKHLDNCLQQHVVPSGSQVYNPAL